MKILILALIIFPIITFISCEQTNKQSNQTKNPDTMVVKKDTAIKRSDTSGFHK